MPAVPRQLRYISDLPEGERRRVLDEMFGPRVVPGEAKRAQPSMRSAKLLAAKAETIPVATKPVVRRVEPIVGRDSPEQVARDRAISKVGMYKRPLAGATDGVTREQRRSRRKRLVRATTVSVKRMTKRDLELGRLLYPDDEAIERPRTRADCEGAQRPCPFVSCAHHLYLDVSGRTGAIKLNMPDLEPWELRESCTLDVADRGGATLEDVGEVINLTRERVRQYEVKAKAKIAPAMSRVRDGYMGDDVTDMHVRLPMFDEPDPVDFIDRVTQHLPPGDASPWGDFST
jgi:hypothetical protein